MLTSVYRTILYRTHRIRNTEQICKRIIKRYFTSTLSDVDPDHVVLVSKSDCIYTNLALEEWLYENEDLTKKSVLLLWKNKPTVVIGRHQNPWIECNVEAILDSCINLARRSSGGGTVYHDEGNLNCSFIKDRKWYNRKLNLELVVSAVTSVWDIDLSINSREDIILDKLYKVSGTASKLGGKKTYHHFTLLYNVDTEKLSQYLSSPFTTDLTCLLHVKQREVWNMSFVILYPRWHSKSQVGVKSRATQSLRSSVKNISDYIDVDFTSLVDVIGRQFLKSGNNKKSTDIMWVTPDDNLYPGLTRIIDRLKDWECIYGKTPKFTIDKVFTRNFNSKKLTLNIIINIDKGRITHVKIDLSPLNSYAQEFIDKIPTLFVNVKFWRSELAKQMEHVSSFDKTDTSDHDCDLYSWIVSCFKNCLIYDFSIKRRS